jgi:hypothetical protein
VCALNRIGSQIRFEFSKLKSQIKNVFHPAHEGMFQEKKNAKPEPCRVSSKFLPFLMESVNYGKSLLLFFFS